MNAQLNVTPLAAKAMLVKLTTRKVTLTSRDKNAEEYLQGELGDSAYVVNKKLFRDPANPINKIISTASEVYTYHRGHTLAYVDKGPRLLPNTQYIDYTAGMRERIGKAEEELDLPAAVATTARHSALRTRHSRRDDHS